MKRKHKSYARPKRPFDKVRIDEEAEIKKEFGLKNKREIWKADAKVRSMRSKAKSLIKATPEEQGKLFTQLQKIGLKVSSIAEVLALDKNAYLERRLQTVVARQGLTTTMKAARQAITHRKVMVDGSVVNKPSFVVTTDIEDKITIKEAKVKVEEAPAEVPEAEQAEVAEETKETEEEVKEDQAEAEGK